MFKLTVITDDKKLPRLLRSFKGLIIGPPEVYLLEGAQEVEGELREVAEDQQTLTNGRTQPSQPPKRGVATKPPGETLPDRVAARLLRERPDPINAEVLRRVTVEAGSSADSYTYVVVALRKWGILSGPTAAGLYSISADAYRKRIEGGH